MRLVSYSREGAPTRWRVGIVVELRGAEPVALVDVVDAALLSGLPTEAWSVRGLLALSAEPMRGLDEAARQLATTNPAAVIRCADVRLGPPVPDPDKVVCVGLNYRDHAEEAGLSVPTAPMLFAKYRNALVGPADPVPLPEPAVSDQVDYEGELAVVIGRRAANVSTADALTYVAGYFVLNDVSARDLQSETGQWLAGKSLDGFAPCGPALVTADEVADPQALRIITRVNGATVQNGTTADMVFTVAEQISFISRVMTLETGDVIATGTPAGVGSRRNPPRFLTDGDEVEVEVDGLGRIANRFVPLGQLREQPAAVAS